jgi:hypothetical protein
VILGQGSPSTLTDLYTVPASKSAVVRIIAANRGSDTTYRIALAKAGAVDSVDQYVAYDLDITEASALSSVPVALEASDVVRALSASGNVTFTIDGIET